MQVGGPTPQYISCGIRTTIIFLHHWEIKLQLRGSGVAVEQSWQNVAGTHEIFTMIPHMKSVKGAVSCNVQIITPKPFFASSVMIANNHV